jgi:hypothetical protein
MVRLIGLKCVRIGSRAVDDHGAHGKIEDSPISMVSWVTTRAGVWLRNMCATPCVSVSSFSVTSVRAQPVLERNMLAEHKLVPKCNRPRVRAIYIQSSGVCVYFLQPAGTYSHQTNLVLRAMVRCRMQRTSSSSVLHTLINVMGCLTDKLASYSYLEKLSMANFSATPSLRVRTTCMTASFN